MDHSDVLEHVHVVYGQGCQLEGLERLPGGVRKQIYLMQLRKPTARCLIYIWDSQAPGYFAERQEAGFEDTQSSDQAPALFDANTRFLLEHGVSVPSVIYRGALGSGSEFAFVEEIEGTHLIDYAATASPADHAEVLQRVHEQVTRLHSIRRSSPGIPDDVADVPTPNVERTAERTLWELHALAETDLEVMKNRKRIGERVIELRDRVTPRSEFTLVHGELPHHILVRHRDREVFLIDIEGIRFFDLEIDDLQCKLFLPESDYRVLAHDDLDPARTDFYTFCWHVSCAYAGSRLVAGGFPDQELARRIYENNVLRTVALL